MRRGNIISRQSAPTDSAEIVHYSLPAQIRAASSLLSFRRQTKAHLFQLSYNWLLTTVPSFFF